MDIRPMLMHGRAYPTIFLALSYRNISTFTAGHDNAKNLSFSVVEAAV